MERTWREAPLVGLLVVLTLVAVGCVPDRAVTATEPPTAVAQSATSARRASQGSNGPVVRIGAALSLSGSARLIGMAQRSAIKLAQDEINANHTLGNVRLEVVVQDDASDREQAAGVFQRFIENDHVVAIMGPTLSDTALGVDPIAQQAAVPVLAISNSASGIT